MMLLNGSDILVGVGCMRHVVNCRGQVSFRC